MNVLSAPVPRLLLYPLFLASVVALLAGGHSASGQEGPALSFDVGTSGSCLAVDEGDEFQIALEITEVEQLMAWEATIAHDFDVIRILEHDLRIFLAQGSGGLIEASEPLPDNNGRHFLSIGGNSSVAVSGSGVLATIKFEAVGEGISVIDIPQSDLNGDGHTNEGAFLQQNGGATIDDVNGDKFFDGPVQSALVSVGGNCGSATEEPTDPPSPAPSVTSPPSGVTTATVTATPTGDGTPAGDGTSTPATTADDDPTGGASGSSAPSNESDQPSPSDGDASEADDDGSSFPVWLVGVLLIGGLGLGAAVVIVALRSSQGRPTI